LKQKNKQRQNQMLRAQQSNKQMLWPLKTNNTKKTHLPIKKWSSQGYHKSSQERKKWHQKLSKNAGRVIS
jgi:hypothetical protein